MIESNMKVLRELPSPQVLKQMYPLPEGLAEIEYILLILVPEADFV